MITLWCTNGSLLPHSWGFEHFRAFYKAKTAMKYLINKEICFILPSNAKGI